MKTKLKRILRRKHPVESTDDSPPRITNETVAAHREEVLLSARKYIYPLRHSKHRVVKISITLLITVFVAFFVYCGVALYKLQTTTTFMYGVTQVVPFPVARAGSRFVSYSSYLFELRRYMHYYQTQQQATFTGQSGKNQLIRLKQTSFNQAVQDAYVKQLAAANHVTVSEQAVNNELALVRSQNRLGDSNEVFKDVLNEFWGWTEDDFKHELAQELLAQAVVTKLDTATQQRAATALNQLQAGANFGTLASQVSDDTATKANGGQYSMLIDKSNRDVAPQVVQALLKLQPGQHSNIINTGSTLEIVENISIQGGKIQAAHISFDLQDISHYTDPLQAKHPVQSYISIK
jgi:hypothetical protein